MILRRPAMLVLSLVACASAGCGGAQDPSDDGQDDDKSAAEATVKSYLSALADGDGGKACSHLTSAARGQVISESKKLDPAFRSASCAEVVGKLDEITSASIARKVCGAGGNAGCERIARKRATDLIDDLKDAEIRVEVSGEAATAGPAAGSEGFDAQLRKIDGEWLISKFVF